MIDRRAARNLIIAFGLIVLGQVLMFMATVIR